MSATAVSQTTPLVSVIVPIYKVEDYIVKCAESLFQQDWPNLELIFVDNNTPDNSITLLRELLHGKYPQCEPFTKIVHGKKQGLGFAREAGLREATGDYIIHVDSDDWVEHDYVSKLAHKAVEEHADIVCCNYFLEYDDNLSKPIRERDATGYSDAKFIKAIHNGGVKAYNWNKLVRSSLYHLDTLVTPITNMHEDIVFQTQICYGAKRIVSIPDSLYHYRRTRKDAITSSNGKQWRRSSAKGLLHLYRQLPKTGGPLDYCAQDLLMRASWYALKARNFSLLHSYPEAIRFLADMPYVKGRRTPIIKQSIMKYYSRLYLMLHR